VKTLYINIRQRAKQQTPVKRKSNARPSLIIIAFSSVAVYGNFYNIATFACTNSPTAFIAN